MGRRNVIAFLMHCCQFLTPSHLYILISFKQKNTDEFLKIYISSINFKTNVISRVQMSKIPNIPYICDTKLVICYVCREKHFFRSFFLSGYSPHNNNFRYSIFRLKCFSIGLVLKVLYPSHRDLANIFPNISKNSFMRWTYNQSRKYTIDSRALMRALQIAQ